MTGAEFLRKLRALGKRRAIPVRVDAARGKGSHQTVYFGAAFTIMRNPKDELKTGTLHAMCASLASVERISERSWMEHFEYPVSLKHAKEGGYVVTCRDLPALVTQGNDKDDALAQAADAMDEVFATLMKQGRAFPAPSKPRRSEYLVSPPAETVAKAALYSALREAKVTKVQLARQLGVDEKEVRRLLDPHYQSKLPRIAQAVAVLGRRLVISLDHA